MSRKIYLDHSIDDGEMIAEDVSLSQKENIDNGASIQQSPPSYDEILNATIKQFPEKLLFNVKEAASTLAVSVEFIRKRIADGTILSVSMGDRKLISLNEIVKLIFKGV
jgi:excisionase family DNA binding protein